jgi:hypothetical protein
MLIHGPAPAETVMWRWDESPIFRDHVLWSDAQFSDRIHTAIPGQKRTSGAPWHT